MVARSRGWLLGLACLVAVLSSNGCTGLGKLHPVSGKANVDGGPMPEGTRVTFWPQTKTSVAMDITGVVDASGNYKMFTNGKSGVPAGKYKVTVSTPPPAGADPSKMPDAAPGLVLPPAVFDAKYTDQNNTPLEVSVPGGNYELSASK
jgi:hypothetical protein